MAYKGFFKPTDPKKYLGQASNIIYRSRWELRFMSYLDRNPAVIRWASEEFFIWYVSPIDGRPHRYFPDFWVEKKNRKGEVDTVVVEIKPSSQSRPPKKPRGKPTNRFIQEAKTWSVNEAKWIAAREYCDKHGWEFMVMTEKDLGLEF